MTLNAGSYGGDTFYISTFNTGSKASITLGGNDWSQFFRTDYYTGTDEDNSQNREFTVSDGTHISKIILQWNYSDIDDLVEAINNQLQDNSVSATVTKFSENQFKITPTESSVNLTIGGKDANNLF